MKKELYQELIHMIPEDRVYPEESMKGHTTFRIGGPADWFVTPSTKEEIQNLVQFGTSHGMEVQIVGNGSNLLVGDLGIRGLVIQIGKTFSQIEVEDETIYVEAGASLARVASQAYDRSLAGFEFAAGIPGTIGGAVTMNAGAYGGEMKDVLVQVEILDQNGQIRTISAEELKLSYRYSKVSEEGWIVLAAVLKLERGNREEIKSKMDEYALARRTKQPLEYPSAGSTFKRPEGYFAGKLIQDSGLRGARVGGAMVSKKHCGFLINENQATAKQMQSLIVQIQQKVKEDSGEAGICLQPEVKMIGEFEPLEPMEQMELDDER
jgi:UDP-N-acetylmuramate dehydrogenase